MRRTLFGLGLALACTGACGCGLFHGDANDLERGSGGVGVLQPQLQPPVGPIGPGRPVLPGVAPPVPDQ